MEAAIEKEEDGEVPTEGVQPETDREGSGTEIERGGRAAAEKGKEKERETKAESGGRGVKTRSEGGVKEAERGLAEIGGGSAPVHLSRLIAQGLITGATQ